MSPSPTTVSLCLLLLLHLRATSASDHANNLFVKTCTLAARTLNESNCWVCARMPAHQDSGFPIQAVPADLTIILTNGTARNRLSQEDAVLVVQHQASFPICFIWEDHIGAARVGETKRCNATMTRSATNPPAIASSVDFSAHPPPLAPNLDPFHMAACRAWPAMYGHCEDMHPWEVPEDAFWICGTKAYRTLPDSWTGSCALGHVVPALRVTKHRPAGKIRNVRDLQQSQDIVNTYRPLQDWELIVTAAIPPLGVATVGWAVQRMQAVVDLLTNETASTFQTMAIEQRELRRLALQNRMALDMILASHGGVCALIGSECCIFVPDSSDEIFDKVKHIATLGALPEDVSHAWLKEVEGWLGSWWGAIVKYIVGVLIAIIFVVLLVKVLFRCITSACQQPASSAGLMPQILTDGVRVQDEELMYTELAGLHNIDIN